MRFLQSPGVQTREIDKTNVVPSTSTSIGGYAGSFGWGPCNKATLVNSEKDLSLLFGTPTKKLANSFETAASFLKYGNALYVSRAIDTDSSAPAFNAKSDAGTTARLIQSEEAFEALAIAASDRVYAKYPGAMGNSIKVEFAFAADGGTFSVTPAYDELVSAPAGTSTDAAAAGISNDEVHVIVIDEDGKFTGAPGTVLEVYENLSILSDAKGETGSSIYVESIINNDSDYIYVNIQSFADSFAIPTDAGDSITDIVAAQSIPYTIDASSAGFVASEISSSLTSGSDGDIYDPGSVVIALDEFNSDEIDNAFLFAQGFAASIDQTTVTAEIDAITASRKDVVGFISPYIDVNDVSDVKTFFDAVSSSSYLFFDSTPVYTYDKYNDQYIWIPACGHIAGLCAETDEVAAPWFSPAGYNRGQLKGVIKLKINARNQADRDLLYKSRINPVISQPGQGILLFGDKTALSKPSAFDRINVRRLFIVLRKDISEAAKYQLFELNDEFTRSMFRSMVNPTLRDVQGRRGITEFLVICDETNNTGEVIDTNNFVGDIYIKPARSINYIRLNFVSTRTGVDFSEQVGLASV